MFSASHVDSLFTSTFTVVQRSQLMLEECERSSNAQAKQQASTYMSSGDASIATTERTVREAQGLRAFASFVAAAKEVGERLAVEFAKRSGSSAQNRRNRPATFPVFNGTLHGLHVQEMWAGQSTQAEFLWSDGGAEIAEMLLLAAACVDLSQENENAVHRVLSKCKEMMMSEHSDDTSSETSSVDARTPQTARKFVHIVDDQPRQSTTSSANSRARKDGDRTAEDGFGKALSSAGSVLSPELVDDLGQRIVRALGSWWTNRMTQIERSADTPQEAIDAATKEVLAVASISLLRELPDFTSMLMYPSLVRWLAMHESPELAERLIVEPQIKLANNLLSDFLSSRRDTFHVHARQLAIGMDLVSRCLVYVAPAIGGRGEESARRTERLFVFLRRLIDRVLVPLENTFTSSAARPGMSNALHTHLGLPLLRATTYHIETLVAARSGGDPDAAPDALTQRLSSTLRTTVYRILMIEQTVAAAEIALASGTGSTASQQRTYERMLQLSGGKITLSLLGKVVESKHAVLEETPARSSDGHRIYRITGGGDDLTEPENDSSVSSALKRKRSVVYVYVDDGVVLYRVDRERTFRQAKRLDELFAYVFGKAK